MGGCARGGAAMAASVTGGVLPRSPLSPLSPLSPPSPSCSELSSPPPFLSTFTSCSLNPQGPLGHPSSLPLPAQTYLETVFEVEGEARFLPHSVNLRPCPDAGKAQLYLSQGGICWEMPLARHLPHCLRHQDNVSTMLPSKQCVM